MKEKDPIREKTLARIDINHIWCPICQQEMTNRLYTPFEGYLFDCPEGHQWALKIHPYPFEVE